MTSFQSALLCIFLSLTFGHVEAFWRMRCGTVQVGRVDPIVSPGGVAGHCHTIAGPNSELFFLRKIEPRTVEWRADFGPLQISTLRQRSTTCRPPSVPLVRFKQTRAHTGLLICTTGSPMALSQKCLTMARSLITWIVGWMCQI